MTERAPQHPDSRARRRVARNGPMLAVAVLLGLCEVATAAPTRPTLAMLGVHAGEGFDAREVATIEELLLGRLDDTDDFRVVGRSDIVALLGFERQKVALGCTSDSCLAEIAGAVGAALLATGDVGRVGGVTVVSLKLIDPAAATVVGRASRTVENPAELTTKIGELVREVVAKWEKSRPHPAMSGRSKVRYALVGVAVAALAGGGVAQWQASSVFDADVVRTVDGQDVHTQTQAALRRASVLSVTAKVLFVAGALAGGWGTYLVVTPSPGSGGELALGGRF